MSRSQSFWIIFCLIVISIGLRTYDITVRSLWFDEAFSWRLIQFPVAEMITRIQADVHPPLYYIVLKGWAYVFGSSVLALRSFSILCAVASIVGAYIFTTYAFYSRRAGVLAAALLALSPWAISYATEARMYTLGMVFTLLSSYALLRAVRKPEAVWFGVYALCISALAYTHYFGFFTIASQGIFALGTLIAMTKWRIGEILQEKLFWGMSAALIGFFALYAVWIPTFLSQRSQVEASYWVPDLSVHSVPDTLYKIIAPTTTEIQYRDGAALISLLPLTLVLFVCLYLGIRYRRAEGVWLTLSLFVVPFLCAIGVSLVGRSIYNDRFLAFAGIFLFIIAARAIDSISSIRVRLPVFGFVVFGLIGSFLSYRNELDIGNRPGAQSAVAHAFNMRAPGEKVIVSSPYVFFPVLHYAKERFGAADSVVLYSTSDSFSHFSGAPILRQEDVVYERDVAAYTGRVWIVETTGFSGKPFEAPAGWQELSRKVFREVFVYQGDIIVREFSIKPL